MLSGSYLIDKNGVYSIYTTLSITISSYDLYVPNHLISFYDDMVTILWSIAYMMDMIFQEVSSTFSIRSLESV